MIILIIVCSSIYFGLRRSLNHIVWIEHTHEAISDAKDLLKLIVDMETGQRGFVITGNDKFLVPYTDGITTWDSKKTVLFLKVADNPKQHQLLNSTQALKYEWLRVAARPEISAR
jgi:CHASE3 domain sensor protein